MASGWYLDTDINQPIQIQTNEKAELAVIWLPSLIKKREMWRKIFPRVNILAKEPYFFLNREIFDPYFFLDFREKTSGASKRAERV